MNSLKHFSNDELISRMEKLVRTERKITHLVLLHIAEIEDRKIFAEMGFDGMYTYLTRGLGYSEGSAYRRLQAARLFKNIPSIADKIEDGSLNLTQLTQVQKCVQESKKNGQQISTAKTVEILNRLENQNSFETQKALALEMNLPAQMHEKIKPQQDDSVRVEITFTQEQFQELETAKNLLSHICPNGSWAEVISALANSFNKKKLGNSPIKTQSVNATGECKFPTEGKAVGRKYISIHTKRDLLHKAQHCCEYQDPKSGRRCGSKKFLEVEHIQPLALGGKNDSNNLRIFCRTHNALAARQAGFS